MGGSELVVQRRGGFEILPAHAPQAVPVDLPGQVPGTALHLSEGLSNAWLLTTPAGRVVINTGMGFEAPVHRRNFDAVSDDPVVAVVFTQGHVDHVGGADAFIEDGTEVIAQRSNAACQADDARIHRFRVRRSAIFWAEAVARADAYMREQREAGDPAEVEAVPGGQSTPTATRTFEDRLDLDFGGTRVELLSVPGGETVDSLVVWLPQHRTAIVGNLFSALFGHVPNLVTVRGDRPRDALAFLDSLRRVRELRPELLCTGHFEPIRGVEVVDAELERIERGVLWLHDAVVDGMERGTDLWTLMRTIEIPSEYDLGEGYGCVRWAVRAIWELYAGWFRHESTTELYGVPHTEVALDLVELAGGVEPVVAAGRARLSAGEPEAALHLVEVALGAEPEDPGALLADIEVHEALLERSGRENFWETGWLQHRIDTSRAKLAEQAGGDTGD